MKNCSIRANSILVSLVALTAAGLGGCLGQATGESTTAIRLNPTPVEQTLFQTQDDIDNRMFGITFDQNFLMMTEDAGRLLLFERPSRLNPAPIAY
ncbi:MAG: hypothetical protein AABZ53_14635 [Planctomycetota bacterium]|mgnify:CR=1 FL=1